MTFEEQFPSLKECGQYGDCVVVDEDIDEETLWITREDIKEHCLDKQRVSDLYLSKALVKEAIEKFRDGFNTEDNLHWRRIDTLNMLIKELGL